MTGAGNYPSCSQNAHTRKYARSMRAVKDSLPTPLENVKNQKTSFEGTVELIVGVVLRRRNKRAWKDYCVSVVGRAQARSSLLTSCSDCVMKKRLPNQRNGYR